MVYDFKIRSAVNDHGKTAYYANIIDAQEKEFLVGYKTKYLGNFGLYNVAQPGVPLYNAADYESKHGFFAYFIEPTAKAESNGSFICLNTYDRAFFTFGFMQFAAHVANGDFIQFLKKLLALPNARQYFPRLSVLDGNIFYVSDDGSTTRLENQVSSQGLMKYLNPTTTEVEQQELICAARMTHWAMHDVAHRNLQVSESVALYQANMPKYHKRFNLHRYPAKVCFMICDILHQGRGTYDRIRYAIDTNGNYEKAFTNLCSVGEVNYADRIKTLKKHIKLLEDRGIFTKKYDAGANQFV